MLLFAKLRKRFIMAKKKPPKGGFFDYCKCFLSKSNLADPTLVAPTLKGGAEERVKQLLGSLIVDEACREHDAVGIVVLTDKFGDILIPNESCSHALVLVQRDGHAFAATAYTNTRIAFTALDGLGQRMGVVGIVAREIAVATEILIGVALLLEIIDDKFLEWIASVVASQSDGFDFHKSCEVVRFKVVRSKVIKLKP